MNTNLRENIRATAHELIDDLVDNRLDDRLNVLIDGSEEDVKAAGYKDLSGVLLKEMVDYLRASRSEIEAHVEQRLADL